MSVYHIQERIRHLSEPLPPEDPDAALHLLSSQRYAQEFGHQIRVSVDNCRRGITKGLETYPDSKLLVLDNVASLAPSIDENTKNDWDPINQWLIELRHAGTAVIFIHHAGKNFKQRGHSGREDALDNVICLTEANNDEEGCAFNVSFEKARNVSKTPPPFALRLRRTEEGLTWEEFQPKKDERQATVNVKVMLLHDELTNKEIAEATGLSKGRVSQIKRRLIDDEYMTADGSVIKKGRIFLKKHRTKEEDDNHDNTGMLAVV